MKNKNIAGVALLWTLFSVSASAEITGSGFLNEDCDGELEFQLWIDNNGDGEPDSSEAILSDANLILSLTGAPELGVESIVTDSSGYVRVENLCEGHYGVSIEPQTLPGDVVYTGAYESGSLLEITGSGLLGDNLLEVELADGEDGNAPEEREIDLAFDVVDCDIEARAACGTATVAEGVLDEYQCEKPVRELSVVWNGADPVRVVAHAGKLDAPVVADFDRVVPGQVVTVAGLEESGSDIVWEIYQAGTDEKIGESSFHVSCSDEFMDGPEDCGLPAGDGKSDDKCTDSCMNDWLFAGYVDKNNAIQCLPTHELTAQAGCNVMEEDGYAVRYRATNQSDGSLAIGEIVESLGGTSSGELPHVASGQEIEFAWFGTAVESLTRTLSLQSVTPGLDCAAQANAEVLVTELPPACDSVAIELRDISHDKFKLRFTNAGDRELGLVQYQLVWPQENERLVEVKWDGDKLIEQDIDWQPFVVHGVEDFLLEPLKRVIPAEDHVEVEFKFDNHVHNSPQVYDVEFDFDTECSLSFHVTP